MNKYLYETHLHTSEVSACASATAIEQVHNYKARGYAGIIITNHFIQGYVHHDKTLPWHERIVQNTIGYELAKKEGDKIGLDVFFGFEHNIDGSDFLTYGISINCLLQNPGMDKLPIEQFSKFVRDNDGYIAQAHPFRMAEYIPNPYPVAPELLDGVEVYNVSMPDDVNNKAMRFAETHGLDMISGSDCHHLGLPYTGGIALSKQAENIGEIIAAIKLRKFELILP